MRKYLFYSVPAFLVVSLLFACSSSKEDGKLTGDPLQGNKLAALINQNFRDAVSQYKVMMRNLPENRFPQTFLKEGDSLKTSGSAWWCSGFYPGVLFLLYEEANDKALYEEAERMLKTLEKEQFNTTTHDLGFMMYCSFGNANRIAPRKAYKQILINSATSLASRFNENVGCIRSWDSAEEDFLVIIDNMMNLELLFWATRVTGDSSFYKIAVRHADTTLKNHFRPDFSSYHVVNYHRETGAVQEKRTAQGAGDSSAWARGQAWGLYGYTLMYRETKDKKYLKQAENIAKFMLRHPNMPEDNIPYWDFNAPGIPDTYRDASAAAIMASALLELSTFAGADARSTYFEEAISILVTLSSDQYKAAAGQNGGFLLKHSVGSLPGGSEIDVPLTYADYYFIEAMRRYNRLIAL